MAGLQSLWLSSRLKPWFRTTDGLWWLMAASQGLWIQNKKINRSKLAHAHRFISLLNHWCPLLPYSYKASCARRFKLSFVIFDIRALWRSGLSVWVPGYQKLQMTALPRWHRTLQWTIDGNNRRLWVYIFAVVAYEFCGSLRLSMFHGGLQWLMMAALGSTRASWERQRRCVMGEEGIFETLYLYI